MNIDTQHKLNLDLQSDIIGRRIAVLGVSGQGKTNTAAVLIEELLTQGLPMTIVDPEGEYWGLKEKYQILVAGSGEHADFPAGPDQAGVLAQLSITEGLSVILDLSDFSQTEQMDFLLAYFSSLWAAAGTKRSPYEVIIEEAHEFIPEGVRTPLKELLTRLALRGRKRGLGSIILSQRSQKVAKDFLTQAEMYFLHRVSHPIDLRVYKDLIPLDARQVEERVGHLTPGQVLFVYNHAVEEVTMRLRHTFHAGATPTIDAQVAQRLQTIDEALLAKLAEMSKATAGRTASQSDKEYQQARQIKELEAENEKLHSEVEELRGQVATLKDLKVSIEGSLPVAAQPSPALPDSVRLERMEVGQVVTSTGGVGLVNHTDKPSRQSLSDAPPATPTPPAPLLLGQATEQNEFERPRFMPHLRRVQNLSSKEKIILALLLERDGHHLNKTEFSQAVGFDVAHSRQRQPGLYSLPFFHDVGRDGIFTLFASWARQSFPRIKAGVILGEVMKALGGKS